MDSRGLVVLGLSLALAGFLIHGCTTPEQKIDKSAEIQLSAEEQQALADLKAEQEIGRNMAGRLLAHYGVVDDEMIVGYINQVGNFVASYGDHPERRYMFHVLDTEAINAFACPGGYILITLGALRLVRDEAELAMVLGHESAHVGLKHMFNTLKNMDSGEMDEIAKKSEKNAKMPEMLQARKRPEPKAESETGATLARYLSGSSGLSVLQAAKAGMTLILEKGLDHKLEFEADREGTKYGINAGYHPTALANYLLRLGKRKSKAETKILSSTHPTVEQRLENIKTILRSMDTKSIVGARGMQRFRKFHASLPKPKK